MKLDRLPRSVLPPAPLATNRPHTFRVHGTTVSDDYAWLKAENWREVLESPASLPREIRDHLERENAYLAAVLRGTGALRKRLISEMRGRIREDDASVPEPDGPFAYFTRYREGGEYPLVCRLPRDGETIRSSWTATERRRATPISTWAKRRIPRTISGSPGAPIRGAPSSSPSGSGTWRPARTSRIPCPRTSGEVAWLGDSSGFYFVELDENHRPARVRRHRIGTPHTSDQTVYEEHDPGFFLDVEATRSGAFVVISAGDHETSEAWLLDRHDPDAKPRLIERASPAFNTRSLITAIGSSFSPTRTAPRISSSSRPRWATLGGRNGGTSFRIVPEP